VLAPATIVGVDENGLGPRLGPLVVTAVTVSAGDERAAGVALGRPGRSFSARIDDSKKLVSYKDRALGEAWARVLGAATAGAATTPADLVARLSLDPERTLRAPCPTNGDHARQCFSTEDEAFEADGGLLDAVRSDLERLERRGLRLASVRVAIVCTRRLNDAVDRGTSRFQVDLHTMERLVLDARARAGGDVVAVCGKVGGYDRYPNAFGPLAGRLHAAVCEGRKRSEYALPGLGTVAFVRDADEKHLVVCLASLVGKYVRDLLTARVVRHHKRELPHLPMVSGYHDPITTRFIADTAHVRAADHFPADCFERRALSSPKEEISQKERKGMEEENSMEIFHP
jgi:ribonuclease HII